MHVHAVGEYLLTTYGVLRYELDPLFIVMTYYNGARGWRLMDIEFNDKAKKHFPPALLKP